jgi:hypothetical protein
MRFCRIPERTDARKNNPTRRDFDESATMNCQPSPRNISGFIGTNPAPKRSSTLFLEDINISWSLARSVPLSLEDPTISPVNTAYRLPFSISIAGASFRLFIRMGIIRHKP